jgi:uncharacterized Zn-binding protein involved in type VI secretion
MPAVQRNSDQNDAKGSATASVTSVRINNLGVIVNGDTVSSHGKAPHDKGVTTVSSGTVRAGNKPITITGDTDSCRSHKRVGGSPNVRIGG